ncbi:hypothetical protein ACLOJK_026611 [Asimina triloba]
MVLKALTRIANSMLVEEKSTAKVVIEAHDIEGDPIPAVTTIWEVGEIGDRWSGTQVVGDSRGRKRDYLIIGIAESTSSWRKNMMFAGGRGHKSLGMQVGDNWGRRTSEMQAIGDIGHRGRWCSGTKLLGDACGRGTPVIEQLIRGSPVVEDLHSSDFAWLASKLANRETASRMMVLR